jgi:hypothetical protein
MGATKTSKPRFKVGDWVSFPFVIRKVFAQIIEDRGPLGFKGRRIYRIRLDREATEPDLFEMPEDEMETAPLPDKAAMVKYFENGGLVTILQANLCNGKDQPRAWLSFTPEGNVTHTLSAERGVVGGATVPYFALLENKVYTAKQEQVLDFLASFGLNRPEAKQVIAAVGTAP